MTPRKLLPFVLVVAALVLTGCGAGSDEIQTDAGPLVIEEVQLSDTWPPDCTKGTTYCSEVRPGHMILVVYLDPVNDLEDGLEPAMPDEAPFVDCGMGSFAPLYIHGLANMRYFVAFAVPGWADSYTLHWEGNDSINLDGYLGE